MSDLKRDLKHLRKLCFWTKNVCTSYKNLDHQLPTRGYMWPTVSINQMKQILLSQVYVSTYNPGWSLLSSPISFDRVTLALYMTLALNLVGERWFVCDVQFVEQCRVRIRILWGSLRSFLGQDEKKWGALRSRRS